MRRHAARVTLGGIALLAFAACGRADSPAGPPARACGFAVWYKPASAVATVEVVGDFNGWARPGRILPADRSDGWRVTAFDLPAGEHTYAIVDDGVWLTDPNVGTTAFHEGQEVTWVDVAGCDAPMLQVTNANGSAIGHAEVAAQLLASSAGDPLDPKSITATTADERSFAVTRANASTGEIALSADGLPAGKYTLTLHAKDTEGRDADEAVATVWIEPQPLELRDWVIYQVMVDRFRGDAGALAPPAMPSGRAGGTLNGVRAAIESGELTALGVNAVWLSPLYTNPEGTFPGADGRPYTSYHGYWPTQARALMPDFGTESDLDLLIAAAHARGVRVVFDVVPNHVHEQHPYFADHKDWFDGVGANCVCGSATCSWADHIEDCWFAPYLPDIDWTNAAAADELTSDVRWWLDRFDGDGVRIDAVPMMPRAATRRVVNGIRARYDHPGHTSLTLGEDFTGPNGYGELRYELGPFGLNSEFHFPLMWTLRAAIASATTPMSDIDGAVNDGQTAWQGSGAVMATMIGNHDVTRFSSESAGDAGGDTWTPAPQSADPLVYEKQALALGAVMTLPGMPVLYYGDEVGLAGRGDPDSRRVMPSDADLSQAQHGLRDAVSRMGRFRACSAAVRRGTYRLLAATAESLVFARELEGADTVVVALFRDPSADLSIALPAIAAGDYVDAFSGQKASLSPELTNLGRQPFSVRAFVPGGSVCSAP